MCLETGLIIHWSEQYLQSRKPSKQKEPKKLGINSVLAMLEIATCLYLIAFIIFVLEMLSYEHKFIKRILDYLTY